MRVKSNILILAVITFFILININYVHAGGYSATHQSKCIEGERTCELGNAQLLICKADGSYDQMKCDYGCDGTKNPVECKVIDGRTTLPEDNSGIYLLIGALTVIIVFVIILSRRNKK